MCIDALVQVLHACVIPIHACFREITFFCLKRGYIGIFFKMSYFGIIFEKLGYFKKNSYNALMI